MYARARRLAYDLLVPASAEGAARGARTIDGPGVLEGLCALAEQAALDDRRLTAGVAALRSIGVRAGPRAREALLDALVAPAAALRSEAARALIGQADEACAGPLIACLRSDDAPIVRQAALRALARLPVPLALSVVSAFDDPVWRVRRDAAHLLMAPRPRGPGIGAASPPATLRALDEAVAALGPPTDAVRGVLEYVRRHAGIALASGGALSPQAPPSRPSYWDEDPAVLLENVRREGDRVLDEGAALVADLLAYQESRPYTECALRLRAWAAALLDRAGRPADFVPIVALLDEPRRPFVGAIVAETLGRLDAKRREAVAARLLDGADGGDGPAGPAALAWAAANADEASFALHVDALLAARHPAPRRAALRRLADVASRPGVGIGVGVGVGLGADAVGVVGDVERLLFAALREDDDEARVVALGALQGAPWASVVAAARPEGGPLWRRAYLAARVARGDAFECEAAALEAQAGDARTRAAVAAALIARGREVLSPIAARALEALAGDVDDRVRAAALDRHSAQTLCARPEVEPSFRVLARAASLLGLPFASLAPADDEALGARAVPEGGPEVEPSDSPFLANRPTFEARERRWAFRRAPLAPDAPGAAPREAAPERPLGATGLRLPPLAISGRYGLPPEAFDEALGRGARLFFWEPSYEGQTHFVRRLAPARRAPLAFIAGSFEAEPRAVRRDAENALRTLGAEAIDVFVLFWARSEARLSDGVAEALDRLREAGYIKTFGLSTHRRELAANAAAEGWPAVMVRHSAAHRGAEREVFPAALAQGTGVLTFSNLCYGRLLLPGEGERPSAADLYRYSLAQPGVSCCISGPRNVAELRENLRVLEAPALPPERFPGLRAWGDRVHQANREFFELIRWR